MKESIFNYLDSISINDYIAHLYNNNSEKYEIATSFLTDGLKKNQKIIIITDSNTPEELKLRLKLLEIDFSICIKNKNISEIQIFYNNPGDKAYKDPIKLIKNHIKKLKTKNKSTEFRILFCCDNFYNNINDNYLLFLLSNLNILTMDNPVIFLNQFEITRVSSTFLLNVLKTHKMITEGNVVYNNSFYINPHEIISKLNFEKSKLKSLSEKEIKVLSYIVSGLSNRNIAKELSISIRTVESHRYNLMKKLNLKNTVDLIKFALKNGIY